MTIDPQIIGPLVGVGVIAFIIFVIILRKILVNVGAREIAACNQQLSENQSIQAKRRRLVPRHAVERHRALQQRRELRHRRRSIPRRQRDVRRHRLGHQAIQALPALSSARRKVGRYGARQREASLPFRRRPHAEQPEP